MSAPKVDVLAVLPSAPSSMATWQVAELAGISQPRALRELRRLEALGAARIKATKPVNRSTLVRHWWQRVDIAAARIGGAA